MDMIVAFPINFPNLSKTFYLRFNEIKLNVLKNKYNKIGIQLEIIKLIFKNNLKIFYYFYIFYFI